ncbi:hypothetical protein V6Z11_D04G092800 [Gossypium hirsutum]
MIDNAHTQDRPDTRFGRMLHIRTKRNNRFIKIHLMSSVSPIFLQNRMDRGNTHNRCWTENHTVACKKKMCQTRACTSNTYTLKSIFPYGQLKQRRESLSAQKKEERT